VDDVAMLSAAEPTTETTRSVALNRRQFLTLAGGTAASAILAACGGSKATDTPKPAASSSTVGASAGPTTAASSAVSGSPVVATGVAGSATAGTSATGATAVSTTAAGTSVAGTSTTGTRAASSAVAGTSATGTGVAGTRPAGSAITGAPITGTTAAGSPSAGVVGQPLAIEATEYAFKTLGSIPAGVTTVQLRNLGKENHEAQLVKLNQGVSIDQLLAAFQQAGNGPPPPDIFTFEGGPAETVPNRTSEVVLNLREGQYALLCFVEAPDKQPHAAKGMVLPITVTAASGAAAALPAGSGTIALGSGTIGVPDSIAAGRSTFRVTNQGKSPRAFFVGSIPADKTLADLQQALADPNGPPPWFQANGGMDGLGPGGTGAVVLTFAPGKYAAVDVAFSDEPPTGKIITVT
jgi:hypothetical protein